MELDELHVLDFRAGAPRDGYSIAARRVGVAGVEVDFSASPGCKDGVRSADGVDLARLLVHYVSAKTALLARYSDAVGHYEVDDDVVFANVDARLLDLAYHRGFALLARYVAGVQNATRGVSALAREVPLAILLPPELHAAVDEILDPLGGVFADFMDDGALAEPCAGDHGVARVLVEGVGGIHHAADATLREVGVAVRKAFLGDEHDLAVAGKVKRAHESGHAGPDHKVIAVNCLHLMKKSFFMRRLYQNSPAPWYDFSEKIYFTLNGASW